MQTPPIKPSTRASILTFSTRVPEKYVKIESKFCEACGKMFWRQEDEWGAGPDGKRRYCGDPRCLRENEFTKIEVEAALVPAEERPKGLSTMVGNVRVAYHQKRTVSAYSLTLAVACPLCRAKEGERCRDMKRARDRHISGLHEERLRSRRIAVKAGKELSAKKRT